ncbi:hypothetical protein [Nostoc sp.]|uniref:hypothetical protein n=1 Tax=Nostoc sp. TaxID=1180 RepID=UPI002FF690CD
MSKLINFNWRKLKTFINPVKLISYLCIHYDLDIAIALEVVLKHNWLIRKISAIHS